MVTIPGILFEQIHIKVCSYMLSMIQPRAPSVSPHGPHYPLNFQLFQRQMRTPGINTNLSNLGVCAWEKMGWWSNFSVFFHIPSRLQIKNYPFAQHIYGHHTAVILCVMPWLSAWIIVGFSFHTYQHFCPCRHLWQLHSCALIPELIAQLKHNLAQTKPA